MQQNRQISQLKAKARKTLKIVRTNISEADRLDYSKSITEQVLKLDEIKNSKIIFIYISYATEVHTHELIKSLLDAGKTLSVPKIINSDFMQAKYFSSWADLSPGTLGILTPENSKPCRGPFDVALIPGLGFTLSGHRIGFGRGYYDKWLAQNKVGQKIALAYEAQLVNDIPIENTDIPMEKIITEKRVVII